MAQEGVRLVGRSFLKRRWKLLSLIALAITALYGFYTLAATFVSIPEAVIPGIRSEVVVLYRSGSCSVWDLSDGKLKLKGLFNSWLLPTRDGDRYEAIRGAAGASYVDYAGANNRFPVSFSGVVWDRKTGWVRVSKFGKDAVWVFEHRGALYTVDCPDETYYLHSHITGKRVKLEGAASPVVDDSADRFALASDKLRVFNGDLKLLKTIDTKWAIQAAGYSRVRQQYYAMDEAMDLYWEDGSRTPSIGRGNASWYGMAGCAVPDIKAGAMFAIFGYKNRVSY